MDGVSVDMEYTSYETLVEYTSYETLVEYISYEIQKYEKEPGRVSVTNRHAALVAIAYTMTSPLTYC